MPASSGQSLGIGQELERTRKEKPPPSGDDILTGDVAGVYPPHRAFAAPGTLHLLRRLPDRSKPITPDAD